MAGETPLPPNTTTDAIQPNPNSRIWVISWSIFVLLLSLAPFVWGYIATPRDARFMGLLWNPLDANAYLSKLEAGRRGEWLFRLTFTSEDHPATLIYTHYYLLGKIGGWLDLPNVFTFHLARLATGALLLWASWRFIRCYFDEQKIQRTAFLLVCFGSGLGWLAWPLGLRESTDLWVAESLSFLSILAQPHYPLAAALLIFCFLWLQDAWEKPSWIPYLKTAVAAFLLSMVHPFLVITLGLVAGIYVLRRGVEKRQIDWQAWLGLGLVGLAALPLPIYVYIVTSTEPIYRGWSEQNQTLSPLPIFYMLGYGFLFVMGLFGLNWVLRYAPPEKKARWELVLIWLGVTCILLYIPVSFQRRFIEGVHLPIVLLATAGLFWLLANKRPRVRARRADQFVILTSLSTLIFLGILFGNIYAKDASGNFNTLYVYNEEINALNWLRANTTLSDTVIASPIMGNYIPAYAGNRTFYGHDLETIDRATKIVLLQKFFQKKMSRAEMNTFIKKYGLRYVYYGPQEARLFATRANDEEEVADSMLDYSPDQLGWATVYSNPKVQIYRLINP